MFGEKYKCSICKQNPKMRDIWGCDNPSRLPESARTEIEGDVQYVYSHCPVRFIPRSIVEFLNIYNYHTDFPSAHMPAYADASPRFLQATQIYKTHVAQTRTEVIKNG